jgi:hypothetical protein
LRGDPQMAAQLLRASLHGMAIHALQKSLEERLLDVGNEEVVADLLKHLSLVENFSSSYQIGNMGERVAVLADCRDPSRFPDFSRFVNSKFPARDALVYLDFHERCERVAKQTDLDAFVRTAERVRDEMDTEFAGLPDTGRDVLMTFSVSVAEAFSVRVAEALARQVMHTRMGQLALGLQVYQHRYGHWPERLDDLRQVGLDVSTMVPLGDKPFGYRVEEGMALLWGFEPTIYHARQVPDDPPLLDDPLWAHVNGRWLWKLPPR